MRAQHSSGSTLDVGRTRGQERAAVAVENRLLAINTHAPLLAARGRQLATAQQKPHDCVCVLCERVRAGAKHKCSNSHAMPCQSLQTNLS